MILPASNNVDLIVLSTHGHSGLSGWNVSGVVQKILLRSYKSTLLVRAYLPSSTETTKIRYKRLFVGMDCSARSEFVLPFAINLAQFHKSQLILETVIEKPRIINRMPVSEEIAELVESVCREKFPGCLALLQTTPCAIFTKELKIKTHISIGDNAIAVLHDMAEEANADLVLLVAHGETGRETLALWKRDDQLYCLWQHLAPDHAGFTRFRNPSDTCRTGSQGKQGTLIDAIHRTRSAT